MAAILSAAAGAIGGAASAAGTFLGANAAGISAAALGYQTLITQPEQLRQQKSAQKAQEKQANKALADAQLKKENDEKMLLSRAAKANQLPTQPTQRSTILGGSTYQRKTLLGQ